jgi:hypothetical protein
MPLFKPADSQTRLRVRVWVRSLIGKMFFFLSMGVTGLANFIDNSHRGIGQIVNLEAIQANAIILDGNSFSFHIAKLINWMNGTQYKQLENLVKFYIKIFAANHKLFIVFDGSLAEYKIQERHSRNEDKVQKQKHIVANITKNCSYSQSMAATLLPPFSVSVVMEAIREIGGLSVKVIVANEEADHLIGHLAKLHHGIVISQDSDFFIYNVPYYIPLGSLECLMIPSESKSSEKDHRLTVKRYSRAELANGIKVRRDHFYILAVLGGSDHFTKTEMESFYKSHANLGFTISSNKKKWAQLIKFVKRFSKFQPNQAQDKICDLLKVYWKEKFREAFIMAQNQYELVESEQPVGHLVLPNKSDIIFTDPGSGVTDVIDRNYILERILRFGLNYKILEIIDSLNFWCIPSLEDCSLDHTSWEYSYPIRKEIYRLVAPDRKIREYFQNKDQMTSRIAPTESIPVEIDPVLQNLVKLDRESISHIKTNWDILTLALRFYIKQKLIFGKKVGNYEIVGWVCSFILSFEITNIDKQTNSIQTINQLVQIESILYCLSFLLPLYQRFDGRSFFEFIDGLVFSTTVQQAKRGGSPKQLLKMNQGESTLKVRLKFFRVIFKNVCSGFGPFIDNVIDYGVDIDIM